MLVLSRRPEEWLTVRDKAGILIGRIQVVNGAHWTRLGFDFLPGFTVDRAEVDRRKHPEDYPEARR